MKLPKQANPIQRTNSATKIDAQISPSDGIACQAACLACSQTSGFTQMACKMAASAAGCSC